MEENANYREINQYSDANFPVNVYYADVHSMQPPGRWLRDYHWHEELQFTLVFEGSLIMHADHAVIHAKKGDVVFINSAVIHAVMEMSEDAVYASLNFPFRLLSFFPGSRMDKDYVLPYMTGEQFPSYLIEAQKEWGHMISSALREITDIYSNHQVQGQEYSICVSIVAIWNLLIQNWRPSDAELSTNVVRKQRLQKMLTYIYEHYQEEITISDLAAVGNISVAECNRVFRDILHVTPYHYLKNYRIQASVSLLKGTRSVSEIATSVGYNQVSNYIATFKKIIGCTPAQYRKQLKGQ